MKEKKIIHMAVSFFLEELSSHFHLLFLLYVVWFYSNEKKTTDDIKEEMKEKMENLGIDLRIDSGKDSFAMGSAYNKN
jgi:cbb3-type cytochrome oxidase subunit 3